MTINRFKWMDITFLTILAIIVDVIAYFFTNLIVRTSIQEGFLETYFIAPSVIFIFLIYIRWGKAAILPNFLLAVLQIILYGGLNNLNLALILFVGYTAWILTMGVHAMAKKNKRFEKGFIIFMSFILIYLMQVSFEWLTSLGMSTSLDWFGNLWRHLINLLICVIALIIMLNQKKLLINMRKHLEKIAKENEADV